jgi:hypothetical protein
MLATPVRALTSSDMSNESPLPTPPQAMHDLLRNEKLAAAARAAARSSLGDTDDGSTRRPTVHRQSSSPSARAASGSSRGTVRVSGSSRSPSSLAVSMGASSHLHRSALGSQMGIMQNQNLTTSTENAILLKPSRPGALTSSSQRSMSYEASPKRIGEEVAKMSTRPSFMSLAASSSSKESNKENLGADTARGHQRRISAARRYSSKRSPSPTSTAVADAPVNIENDIYRRLSPENDKKQTLSLSARSMMKKPGDEMSTSNRRRPVEGNANVSPRQDTHEKDSHQTDEGVGMPSSSQLVTPGFTANGRVLRSGQAPPKHSSALWSVGRSMKRIGEYFYLSPSSVSLLPRHLQID